MNLSRNVSRLPDSAAVRGILCACGAWFIFSLNDVAIKFLSDDYALHQIVLIRSFIGICITLTVLVPLSGGLGVLKTKRPFIHIFRGSCIVVANMTFFVALASMGVADVTAIFFVAPLLITVLSFFVLGEKVGIRRWCAVIIGLIGVIVMIRPGQAAFTPIALLPLLGAAAYATMQITTRKVGITESATTMSFYIQMVFVVFSICFGFLFSDGRYANPDHPSIDFLFRAWEWPGQTHWFILAAMGVGSGFGAFLVNQAYRVTEATVVAPFEYLALPLAVTWSVLLWGVWPDISGWIGICLILGSGLFVFFREMWLDKQQHLSRPLPRHR